jgi:tripeptidyl-peptidase I
MKLAAMGVTVVVSSGDNGVAGYGCVNGCDGSAPATSNNCACDASSGTNSNFWSGSGGWSGSGYFPKFPASSPYVTVVGATAGPEAGQPERVAQSNSGDTVTSGGGFSTVLPQPAWQSAAVSGYFRQLRASGQPRPSNGFNPLGRAYPDVSFIGVEYQVVVQGWLFSMFGTSASAPVFAAMITNLNALRAAQGKSPVGFLNPTLYSTKSWGAYTDVIKGRNSCCSSQDASSAYCCSSGFSATTGWDPTSGFGSITFPKLLNIFG